MKPCSKKRELIALLALGELDVQRARDLRAHLETCEACRHYLEEISGVTETLAAAHGTPAIQTSESFHRKVMAKLQAEKSVSLWEVAGKFIHGGLLNWHVALPMVTVFIMLMAGLVIQRLESGVRVSRHMQLPLQFASVPDANADILPTIANYQMAANQSLQTLDELLTQQAKKALPSAPIYTASMLTLANAPE